MPAVTLPALILGAAAVAWSEEPAAEAAVPEIAHAPAAWREKGTDLVGI